MPSADQVPVISPHSTMHWHVWGVLIAGSTRLCITCCSPSQLCHLGRPPRQQGGEPRPMLGAMEFGVADHGQRPGREQATQISVASFADVAELFLAPA